MTSISNSSISTAVNLGNGYHYVPYPSRVIPSTATKSCAFGHLENEQDKSRTPVAVVTYKVIQGKTPKETEAERAKALAKLDREVEVIQLLNERFPIHPNIIRLLGFWDLNLMLESGNCDLMDIIENGHINPFTGKKFRREKLVQFLTDGLYAVIAMHSIDWVHLDLKPENFVLVNGIFKLIDFNTSFHINARSNMEKIGTPEYLAPEIWLYKHDRTLEIPNNQLKNLDCWSFGWLGILFFNSKKLTPPWLKIENCNSIFGSALAVHRFIVDYYQTLPVDNDPIIAICRRMCVLNPADRLSAQGALDAVELSQIRALT